MTEDELTAALRELCVLPGGSPVRTGIGDDAAVWRPSRSAQSVITTDALLEGVHFTRAYFTYEQIGRRALACNLSDIAAMGARPVLATVALGLPAGVTRSDVLALYAGMTDLARRHRTAIAGGDLVRSEALMLSITVVGEVRATNLKLRSGARAGDVLAVTGPLGASRAGYDSLSGAVQLDEAQRASAESKHRTPEPRVAEGRWLAASANVHAMIDLSDGLARDVTRMAAASGLGATIDRVPVDPAARFAAQARGVDPARYACEAGEDFELLVAVAPRALRHLGERFERRFGRALYGVGTLHEGSGARLRNGNGDVDLAALGWDHLAQ